MPDYKRTIKLGSVSGEGYGYAPTTRLPVEIEVEIRDRNGTAELAMSGSVWRPSRNDIVSGGQNRDEIAAAFPSNERVQRMVEVWKRWHLNTMRAGCEHQRAEGWDKRPIDPSKPLQTYGRHFEGQRQDTWNMLGWVRPVEHPEGLLGKPCPTCGYRYGSAWRTEPLPEGVIEEVKSW